MSTARLGEHAALIRGITFKPADKCDPQAMDAVVCMRTKNVQATLDESDLIAVPSSLVKNSAKMLSMGDILVSSANSWNLVGKCCRVQELKYPSTAGAFISILRPTTEKLDSGYLYRWFSSDDVQRRVRSFGNQTTNISNLNHKRTLGLQMPLPPLAEQKRIAGILDAADALRDKRRESLAQLDTLLQSTFLDMFGDPITNPMGWEVVPITEAVAGKYGIKAGPFGSALKKQDYVSSGFRIYGQEQVIAGRFDVGDYYIDDRKFMKLQNCAVAAGDILVSLVGSYGRVLVVPEGIEPGIINPRLLKISPRQELVTSLYLATLIQNEATQRKLENMSHGGTMGILNVGLLKQLTIPTPPIDLQHRFAAIVESIEHQKASQSAHLDELDTLFDSLQSRAFRGDL